MPSFMLNSLSSSSFYFKFHLDVCVLQCLGIFARRDEREVNTEDERLLFSSGLVLSPNSTANVATSRRFEEDE